MAIQLTVSNILQFFAIFAPLLLGFFIIIMSVFNQDAKGIVYFGGVLSTCIISTILMNMIQSTKSPNAASHCSIIDLPFNATLYNNPSLSSVFIAFTFAYLLLPMRLNDQMNYTLIAFLAGLFVLDAVNSIVNSCTTFMGVFIGLMVGAVCGTLYYGLFHFMGGDSFLYFDLVSSNKVYCSRPKKQTFKCEVYKNGELVKTM